MNEPIRTQWQIRCAFNGFCKLALKREAMNAHRDTKQRQLREVTFSDLSPLEEKQLYVCDEYFADDEAEQSFVVGGKEIVKSICVICEFIYVAGITRWWVMAFFDSNPLGHGKKDMAIPP